LFWASTRMMVRAIPRSSHYNAPEFSISIWTHIRCCITMVDTPGVHYASTCAILVSTVRQAYSTLWIVFNAYRYDYRCLLLCISSSSRFTIAASDKAKTTSSVVKKLLVRSTCRACRILLKLYALSTTYKVPEVVRE
jgi:hypothetical protein